MIEMPAGATIRPFRLNTNSPQSVGLIGWYPMNQQGGATLFDFSAFRRHAPLSNMTLSDAWNGSGLHFDKTDDYVEIADADDFSIGATGELSFSFWWRPESTTGDQAQITKGGGGGGVYEWEVRAIASDLTVVWWNTVTAVYLAPIAFTISTNIWYFVVAVLQQAIPRAALYINGALHNSATGGSGTPALSGVSPMRIGRRGDNFQPCGGTLLDMRVYRRALTDADVWGMYDPDTRWDLYAPVPPFPHVSVSPAAYAQVAYRWRAASGSLAAPG